VRWFGLVECKDEDDTNWIKCCTVVEADGIRHRGHLSGRWLAVVGCNRPWSFHLEDASVESKGRNKNQTVQQLTQVYLESCSGRCVCG